MGQMDLSSRFPPHKKNRTEEHGSAFVYVGKLLVSKRALTDIIRIKVSPCYPVLQDDRHPGTTTERQSVRFKF
jgi:hypothetical protein